MKYSPKQDPPQLFVAWLEKKNSDWLPTYKSLQNPEMTAVRDALLAEQEYVCAYCGRELPEDRTNSHIDHFRPQAHYKGENGSTDLTLSYDNFVASCGPPGRKGVPSTCGHAKGNSFNEAAHISPWDPTCEQRFTYGSSGVIVPTDPEDAGAVEMIKILRLEDESLAYERSVRIMAIETVIASGVSAEAEYRRQKSATDGKRIGFSHVAARYIEAEFLPASG